MLKRILVGGAVGVLVLLVLIQFVPYGHNHTNPPVAAEPKWDSPQTRELAAKACFDCHSNQTVWPWYSNVAPVSWLIQRDVEQGRKRLNFSDINSASRGLREASREIQRGEMPQWYYVLIHPNATLSASEKQVLINGLSSSVALR
jgi:hypothetical protein